MFSEKFPNTFVDFQLCCSIWPIYLANACFLVPAFNPSHTYEIQSELYKNLKYVNFEISRFHQSNVIFYCNLLKMPVACLSVCPVFVKNIKMVLRVMNEYSKGPTLHKTFPQNYLVLKWPPFQNEKNEMPSCSKWPTFQNDHLFKITTLSKWPPFHNDHSFIMNTFSKWPPFQNDHLFKIHSWSNRPSF